MSARAIYLAVYNTVQLFFVLLVIGKLLLYNLNFIAEADHPILSTTGLTNRFPVEGSYEQVHVIYSVIMFLQWIEIVHSFLGITSGSPVASLVQVFFKSLIFFGCMEGHPEFHNNRSFPLLLLLWSLGDAARYPFYIAKQLDLSDCYPITWIRYSAWVILYPLGIGTEAFVAWSCLDRIAETGRWSLRMPNALNFGLELLYVLYIYLGLVPFGTYFMLSYMARQRSKVLGGGPIETKAKIK